MTENALRTIIDTATGRLLVEDGDLPQPVKDAFEELLGQGEAVTCARPPAMLSLPPATWEELVTGVCVRISGYWHHSLIEGPGRRSVAKLQGCPIRCSALCTTPDSWDAGGGYVVPVQRLADALLDPSHARDGISVLGGEPMGQPDGLLALIRALRTRGCPHILLYSGYTYGALRRMARHQPVIDKVLDEADVLVDGPFIPSRAKQSGPWTGSGNQRVIDMRATRQTGQVVLLEPT